MLHSFAVQEAIMSIDRMAQIIKIRRNLLRPLTQAQTERLVDKLIPIITLPIAPSEIDLDPRIFLSAILTNIKWEPNPALQN